MRANQQTRAFERALTAAGVTHSLVGTLPFVDRAEVRDVLAWLRVVANPDDVEAFRRAVTVPRRGVGQVTVDKIITHATATSTGVLDACRALLTSGDLRGQQAEGVRGFMAAVGACRRAAANGSVTELLVTVLTTCGVRDAIVAAAGEAKREEKAANLDEMLVAAKRLDNHPEDSFDPATAANGTHPGLRLHEHLMVASDNTINRGTTTNPTAGDGDVVVISTIHAAKGKEYDHVWVAGAEEGIIPHARSAPEDTAEERRLFFVACSRAKRTLTVSRSLTRWVPGSERVDMKPTRFLADIPPSLTTTDLTDAASRVTTRPHPPTARVPARDVSRRPSLHDVVNGNNGSAAGRAGSLLTTTFTVGQQVRHATFGVGEVVQVDARLVKVVFPDGRTRQFLPTGPHLRPL